MLNDCKDIVSISSELLLRKNDNAEILLLSVGKSKLLCSF